jgi:hypothetical protein
MDLSEYTLLNVELYQAVLIPRHTPPAETSTIGHTCPNEAHSSYLLCERYMVGDASRVHKGILRNQQCPIVPKDLPRFPLCPDRCLKWKWQCGFHIGDP